MVEGPHHRPKAALPRAQRRRTGGYTTHQYHDHPFLYNSIGTLLHRSSVHYLHGPILHGMGVHAHGLGTYYARWQAVVASSSCMLYTLSQETAWLVLLE